MKRSLTKGVVALCALLACQQAAGKELPTWEEFKEKTLERTRNIEGWCERKKAAKLMELVHQYEPSVCVEIGVFCGASLLPVACALKFLGCGVIYAIDPWDHASCLVGYKEGDPNAKWWSEVDMELAYQRFLKSITQYRLQPFVKILKESSRQASFHFAENTIDMLHIDGNHTEAVSLEDVTLFLPKVKKGGVIIFDDANWSSTSKTIRLLYQTCRLDKSCKKKDGYLIFIKK